MRLLIFNPFLKGVTLEIIEAIRDFPSCQVLDTPDHISFKNAFASCLSGETIIVFFVNIEKDMTFLEEMNSKFVDVKLIINHPEHQDNYQARILNLCPRMVTVTSDCALLLSGAVRGIVKQRLKENTQINNIFKGVQNEKNFD